MKGVVVRTRPVAQEVQVYGLLRRFRSGATLHELAMLAGMTYRQAEQAILRLRARHGLVQRTAAIHDRWEVTDPAIRFNGGDA